MFQLQLLLNREVHCRLFIISSNVLYTLYRNTVAPALREVPHIPVVSWDNKTASCPPWAKWTSCNGFHLIRSYCIISLYITKDNRGCFQPFLINWYIALRITGDPFDVEPAALWHAGSHQGVKTFQEAFKQERHAKAYSKRTKNVERRSRIPPKKYVRTKVIRK